MNLTRLALVGALVVAATLAHGCGARTDPADQRGGTVSGGGSTGGGGGAGGGGDTCDVIVCDAPPPPVCVSASTLRVSSPEGTCAAGACEYAFVDSICPSGCGDGMCTILPSLQRISSGFDHTCAVTATGRVKCWGRNNLGNLGDGSQIDSSLPVDVTGLASGVLAISSGSFHTCALTSADTVACWGQNFGRQLGLDIPPTFSPVPVTVAGLSSGVVAISAGGEHTCALLSSGAVECWGTNAAGALGDGSMADSSAPVGVAGLSSGVLAVSAGGGHTCAITAAGGVKCWGENGSGQVGNGSTLDSPLPVEVVGLSSGVLAVSAGGGHTCAVTSAGGVKCWGSNAYGQLGADITLAESTTPVDVANLPSGVVAVVSANQHTCAITATGAVQCWGWGNFGQLGNGSAADSPVPIGVMGLSANVVGVCGGVVHTCALISTGAVECWGTNGYGQLGNNSNVDSLLPVSVLGL